MSGNTNFYDVVIGGAGPVGLALACSLADFGMRVALAERQPESALANPAFDGREIALTRRSIAMLRELGAWSRIPHAEISALGEAQVINGASPRAIRFLPPHGDAGDLGNLAPNHLIRRALFEAAAIRPSITLFTGRAIDGLEVSTTAASLHLSGGTRLSATLAVAADSRFSDLRRHAGIAARMLDFGKTMLVCRMAHDTPHRAIATEWFGFGQTLAILPLNPSSGAPNISSLVLTLPARDIARVMALDPTAFSADMAQRAGWRLGEMRLISTRHTYPLVAVYADRFVGNRFALVGDAAVGMHPVTAHGFNFGMDGQRTLSGLLRQAAATGGDLGGRSVLHRYQMRHRRDTAPLFLATCAAARLYTDDRLPARILRDAGIRAGAALAPTRRALAARLTRPASA